MIQPSSLSTLFTRHTAVNNIIHRCKQQRYRTLEMNVHRGLWTKLSIAVQVAHKMSSSQKPNSCDFTLVYIHGRQAFAQIVQKIVTRKWSPQTILVEDVLVKPGQTVAPGLTRPVLRFTSDTKKAFVCLDTFTHILLGRGEEQRPSYFVYPCPTFFSPTERIRLHLTSK